MMDAAERRRTRRALELFDSACELEASDRTVFLCGACGDDLALRAEVDALLAAEIGTDQLAAGVKAAAKAALRPTGTRAAGAAGSVGSPELGLDRYEVVGTLGQGGMGTVYLARDRELRREVAIKVIRDTATAVRVERFQEEARIMARMEHRNIVPLYDAGSTAAGQLYTIMPVVRGGTLADTLDRLRAEGVASHDGASLRELIRVLIQALTGVAYAHARGIIHRDLKPSNIVLSDTEQDEARVLDWGISKVLADPGGTLPEPQGSAPGSLTQTGEILGTWPYLAPELARGEPASTASDVYAIGAILYELLTLSVPFRLEDPLAVLEAHRQELPQPPRLRAPSRNVPPALESLCLAALEKDPAARPSTGEALRRLRSWLEPAAELQVSPPRERAGLSPRARRIALGAVVLALVAATAFVFRERFRPAFAGPLPEMVLLQAGTFQMGSPPQVPDPFSDEYPHTVSISRPFQLALTEVTREQYAAVMGEDPSTHTSCGPSCPVSDVTWLEAIGYCNRLSELTKLEPCYTIDGARVSWPKGFACRGYRLPTEAEWEYAAKAGHPRRFAGTDSLDDVCRYANVADASGPPDPDAFQCNDGYHDLSPVASFLPNEWGLFDMTGNLLEWLWDWKDTPPHEPTTDPIGPASGIVRVVHGGSFRTFYRHQRLSARHDGSPGNRSNAVGFRIARSQPAD